MPSPSFGVFVFSGEFSGERGGFLHGVEIGVVALRDVEPFLLALVARERGAFARYDARDVDVPFGPHELAHRVPISVRRGVIDRDVLKGRGHGRFGRRVGHAAAERGGYGEPDGVLMIFHIVGRGLAEDDVRLDFAHRRNELQKRAAVVEDLQIVDERFVIGRAEIFRGRDRLGAPRADDLLARHGRGSPRPVGDRHVVKVPAAVFQEQHRPRHSEFNIVGMRGNGEHGLFLFWFHFSYILICQQRGAGAAGANRAGPRGASAIIPRRARKVKTGNSSCSHF